MLQTLFTVAAFVLLLALLPLGIRWVQARAGAGGVGTGAGSKVVSAVAVGPHQRVVTVEVGPPHARVCLVLGVTAQSVACLHTSPAQPAGPTAGLPATQPGAQPGAQSAALPVALPAGAALARQSPFASSHA